MAETRFEIYLLRHADAGDPDAWRGDESDRPLSPKGKRHAQRLGEFLAGIGFVPTAVVSSPKLRARQTAEAVADAVGGSVTLDDRLGEGVELEMLDALADEFAAVESPGRLLLVGHDPDFSTVAAALCDAPSLQLSKGAVARIDLDGRPKPGAGRLRWLIPPDALAPPS